MNRKEFFDRHAEKWDTYITEEQIKKIKSNILPKLKIKKGEKVLDAGCGTGIMLPFLSKKTGDSSNITALDYSEKMIEIARKKYGKSYNYVCQSISKTSFKDNFFDAVVCFNAFPHFPYKLNTLREIHRILKKNGRIYIAHSDSRKNIIKRHRETGDAVKNDILPSKKEMIILLKNSGFKNIKITENKDYYFASAIK